MLRSDAVRRINDGIGFRPDGHSLEAKIILRLQEAQRDLEQGKTLPRFLIQEDQNLVLPAGERSVPLPTGFIREDDENRLHYTSLDSHLPTYLMPLRYYDAVRRVMADQRPDQPSQSTGVPTTYVVRKSTVDFITFADIDYTLIWNYYKADSILTTDVENLWLANAPEWLIGEAGYRIAQDLEHDRGMQKFDDMRQRARAALFGDILADEDAHGQVIMGRWL